MRRNLAVLVTAFVIMGSTIAGAAQSGSRPATGLTDGKALFLAGCAGCHGPDGSGAPDSTVGFEKPPTFPDFSGCDQTTPETQADWWAVIHDGGKARGFSRIMPAFGELLTPRQIDALVGYIRSLCQDRAWPVGELNLPRALNTEKAFPENETVLTSSVATGRVHDVASEVAYEQRIGARSQLEVAVPFSVMHAPSGTANGGIGDIAVGLKHVLFSSMHTGSIASVQGEIALPTGNADKGLGSGTTAFEVFGAFGQMFRRESFLQAQGGGELPTDTEKAPRGVFARVAAGKILREDHRTGRMWVPMVELLADRELEDGASTDIDVVPQMQVTLSRRQHVRASLGVQMPANHREGRPTQVMFYVLWDWFDGGLFEGWK